MAPLSISISNFIGSSSYYNGGGATDERFIISVKTDNAGTSATNQFTIPTSTSGITQAFNYDIETSDGQTITGNTGDTTITFPSAGTYDIFISGSFPYMRFANGGDRLKLLDIKNFGIYALGSTSQVSAFRGCSNMVISATDTGHFENVTSFGAFNQGAWQNCSSLTSFPLIDTSSATSLGAAWAGCSSLTSFPLLDTSNVTYFGFAWAQCSSLTSFPLIDTSSGTNFFDTWVSCNSLTSFPLLDTSNVTVFRTAWSGCSSLTSFPLIDTSSGTNFQLAWVSCNSLTSFPLIDTSSGTLFDRAWYQCSSLTSFPANAFDTNIATNYTNAFTSTNLTTQSIDDILVSLDTNGVSNGTFTQSGGQAPSATGQTAIDNLVIKGWTITTTGGYQPPQLLLDEYPNAAAAYSLRELSTAFIGQPIIRVLRSSDNSEQDFTATEITDGTLTTFTGANYGYVSKWYDQSGNNIDGSQSAIGEMTTIVINGVLNTVNGKPCIFANFPNRDAFDEGMANNLDGTNASIFGVYYGDTNNGVGAIAGPVGSNFAYLGIMVNGSVGITSSGAGTPSYYKNGNIIVDSRQSLYDSYINNQDVLISCLDIDFSASALWQNGVKPFQYATEWNYLTKIKEFIVYNTDQTTNKTGVETNINNAYSIY